MATRNEKGQFVKGHPGGPGRPRREVERDYLNTMLGVISQERWEEIVEAVYKRAKRGDIAAATWLGNYTQGKPTERLDVTSNDEALTLNVVYKKAKPDGSA